MRINMSVDDALTLIVGQLDWAIPGYGIKGIALTKTEVIIDYEKRNENDEIEGDEDAPALTPEEEAAPEEAEAEGAVEDAAEPDDELDIDEVDDDGDDSGNASSSTVEEEEEEEDEPVPAPKPKARTSLFQDLKKPVNKK